MNILVTGGAGYIGCVVVEECIAAGHNTIVLDNLSKGHREHVDENAKLYVADLHDTRNVINILSENSIEIVIHMAASSLVSESNIHPETYYHNNVVGGLSLLNAMRECSVRKIVFSSTAAVYGEGNGEPFKETDLLEPTNVYGETKLAFEKALGWFEKAYGIRHTVLRYFNAAGASKKCGELHEPETHLIPLVLRAAAKQIPVVEIFGTDYPTKDGTCIRDYIHVVDLARAHLLAFKGLDQESAIYNLGCGGTGYSIREVIAAVGKVTGLDIPTRAGNRRSGDPAILIASSDKIKRYLEWEPEFQDLESIVGTAWEWLTGRTEFKNDGVAF
jgi:UDP-glucose 4-epimerase